MPKRTITSASREAKAALARGDMETALELDFWVAQERRKVADFRARQLQVRRAFLARKLAEPVLTGLAVPAEADVERWIPTLTDVLSRERGNK